MDWVQFVIFLVSIFGLYLFNRAEARADARHMDEKLKSHESLISSFLEGIRQEMKDFHGRLCTIEERSRDK